VEQPLAEKVCTIREKVAGRIGDNRYRTWFGGSTEFALDGSKLDVTVANEFIGNWITTNYMQHLLEVTRDVLGEEPRIQVRVKPNDRTAAERPPVHNDGSTDTMPRARISARPAPARSALRGELESFVVGPSNELAFSVASTVVRAPGTGPFSLAGHLMGTESFLLELAMADRHPGRPEELALRRLLELTTQALVRFATACLDAGADLVQAGDSLASLDMISPAMYRKWAWPMERTFFETLRPIAAQRGAVTLLHICGNMSPVLEDMAATGAHILELDHKVSLHEARQRLGPGICLMGNLDPVDCLWRGSPAKVATAARDAIAAAGRSAFILGSGCEVPVLAPQENLFAMITAARP